ncbi:MAG: hypothetical protein AB7P04_10135 [Bacteriovoracia bacterium]
MKATAICSASLFVLAVGTSSARAYETDQFTLPKKPLQDIGSDISAYVYESLEATVNATNDKIDKLKTRLVEFEAKHVDPAIMADVQKQIEELRSNHRLANEVYSGIDGGVLLTNRVEGWVGAFGKLGKKYGKDATLKFRPGIFNNVYAWATHIRGPMYAIFSSTINLYGVELGTDKLGHFFKQGIQYYRRFTRQVENEVDPADAEKGSVGGVGKIAEGSYFGMGLTGVYSNADLATNLAGLKFYQNILAPLTIGETAYPSMLRVRDDGKLEINPAPENAKETVYRRFVSEHMNEAMNPSWIEAGLMRSGVRKNVKKRCKAWKARYPELTKQMDDERVRRLSTWYGQDYGHKGEFDKLVSIGNVCFE